MAAGGSISDQTRIKWFQEKISREAATAMEEYRRTVKNLGKLDARLDTDWLYFSNIMIMIGSGIGGGVAVPVPAVPTAPAVPV